MTTTNDGLMKLDCIGRIRFSREQRETILDAYATSGLSGPQFCAQHGVKYQTFATWLQNRKRNGGGYPALPAPACDSHPFFALAEMEPANEPVTAMEVNLPGGASMLLRDSGHVALAAALIRELASNRPC